MLVDRRCGVLVTRPVGQQAELVSALRARGLCALCFAAMTIELNEPGLRALATTGSFEKKGVAIWTSRNAVQAVYDAAVQVGFDAQALGRHTHFAIGRGTAEGLASAGVKDIIRSAGVSSSEALLALAQLRDTAIAGRHVHLFKGVGGRTLLAQCLEQRGASVHVHEVYRRGLPRDDFNAFVTAHRTAIDVVIITSVQALDNLFALADAASRTWLATRSFVVPSQRVGARFHDFGMAPRCRTLTQVGVEEMAEAAAGLCRDGETAHDHRH